MSRMPFEQTIFLDTDTYVMANLEDLFDLLQRFDVAAAQAPGYTKGADIGQSEAFTDFNTGVIPYRRTPPVGEFLTKWVQLHEGWSKSPPFGGPLHCLEQHAFRRALWESELSFYVLSPEYNYRSIFWGRVIGSVKIIHGRIENYENLATEINAGTGPEFLARFHHIGRVARWTG